MATAAVAATGRRRPTGTPVLVGTLGVLAACVAVEVVVGATNPFMPTIVLVSVLFACLGAAVARRRPGHPVGTVLRLTAAVGVVTVATAAYVDAALALGWHSPVLAWVLWLNRWVWLLVAAAPVALLFVFPDGRLPSPRWRPVAWTAAALVAVAVVQAMGMPFEESFWHEVPVDNPFGARAAQLATDLGVWPAVALVLADACGAAAVVARRARASGDARERLRWVVPVALANPVGLAAGLLLPWEWTGVLEMATGVALAVVITVATVRHRMYDADVALNRAVVYALLVAALVSCYVGVVVLVSSAAGQVGWLPSAVGAAVVAVAFGPLLHLLRRAVDELFFGARRSPERVASRMLDASRLDDGVDAPAGSGESAAEALLGRALATLRSALRLPWARLETGGLVLTCGEPRTSGVTIPVHRGAAELGTLVIGRRYDDEQHHADDPALAVGVAQLALTVQAVLAVRELREARDRLLDARSEERLRIHRDLHDGLGPTLAGVCLGLEAAEELAGRDPDTALASLPELRVHARKAVDDVRHLVDGLRPPELDRLGLTGALREQLTRLVPNGRPSLHLSLPHTTPALAEPAELAAYRICLEAVTNAVRHAEATTCEVTLRIRPDHVELTVSDDGCGIAGARAHVGLGSMADRAGQAGGRLEVTDRHGGGTRVCATLPLAGTP